MNKIKPHLPNTLKSSLAYGLGLGLGIIITGLLYATVDVIYIGLQIPPSFLFIGIGIAILIEAIGFGVGGAIGGLSLTLPPDKQKSWWGKAWRSGLSMGLIFSLMLFLFIFFIFIFTFYSRYELDRIKFAFVFAFAGALFGGVFGLVLGLFLVRKHAVLYVALAGLIGFGIGGFGLGEGIRRYLLTAETFYHMQSGNRLWLVLAFFFFGLAGGAAMGFIFSYVSKKSFTSQKPKWWHWAIVGVIAMVLVWTIRPVLTAAADALTPSDANLEAVLDLTTIGTHWSDTFNMSNIVTFPGTPQQPIIAANEAGQMAQTWSQIAARGTSIYWLPGEWDKQSPAWQTAVNVSNSNSEPTNPEMVIDSTGKSHIVWEDTGSIRYSQCKDDGCTAPLVISQTPICAPATTSHVAPTLAIDNADNLMAVWQTDEGQLMYGFWSASIQNPVEAVNCVPLAEPNKASLPRLDGSDNGHFALAYVAGENPPGAIHTISYIDNQWQNPSNPVGNGRWPNIYLDKQNEIHLVWCNNNEVRYATKGSSQTISNLTCDSRPELAQDSRENLHVVWYGNTVVDTNGYTQPQSVLYESTLTINGWSEPAIISRTSTTTQPSIAATESHLHLVWHNTLTENTDIAYASFSPYSCDENALNGISQIAFNVARRPEYRPVDDLIPYCQNQFHQLVFMSNPDPGFSDQTPNPNGGFDAFAQLAQTAKHEVLFTTMWYNTDKDEDSPGYVLAKSVAALYEKLKANPEQYPRGITVRILLGNPPQLNLQPFSDQPYAVLADLRNAGVDKMVDPDIGWRVEVADFDGAMPHSHAKFMIVDGKTILAAGFNMEYKHYAVDHASGLGEGKQDLGLLVTGPVVQNSHRVFDDLWRGSASYSCSNFYPAYIPWQATCRQGTGVVDHVPEVRKYYLPGADSTVFSMYRSKVHDEADQIVENSVSAAQHQVDAMHTMFAMEMVCDLNLLFELCDFRGATDYLQGLMKAAENGAKIRLIISPQPLNGIENAVAYDVFINELEARGLRDQVEIRFFKGPVHYKTTLIDNEFLVVGSQNFHYSAYGRNGLSEYSLGTDDGQAIEDYQRLFEYQWEQAIQR